MAKLHLVTNDEIAALNKIRENTQRNITIKELKEALKSLNYPTSMAFISCLTDGVNPPVTYQSVGIYRFNPNPIHIDRLKVVWNKYADLYDSRKRKTKSNTNSTQNIAIRAIRKAQLDSVKRVADAIGVSVEDIDIVIERAIALLKQQGYKVLRPVTQFEECLSGRSSPNPTPICPK